MRLRFHGRDDDRGAVLAIVALSLVVLVAFSAMAVDLGRLMIKRRDLQAIADLAALDIVRDIDGSPYSSYLSGGPKQDVVQHDLEYSVQRNGGNPPDFSYELGMVTAVGGSAKGQAFTPAAQGNDVPNAVRVTGTGSVSYVFAQVIGQSSGSTSRRAIASLLPKATWQLGSFLVGTAPTSAQQGLLNSWLGQALGGGSLGLTAVSYQGLASSYVTLRQISTQMGLASPNSLASGTVNARQFFNAAADAAQANGASAATVSAARTFATTVGATQQLNFGGVIPGGSITGSSGYGSVADTNLSLLGLLQGSASVINGSNVLSIPGLSVNIPNLGTVDLTLKLIEAPIICGPAPVGSSCSTSQVQLGITTHVNLSLAALLPGLVNPTLTGTITFSPSVAGATSTLSSATCFSATNGIGISLAANPISATASESLTLGSTVLGLPISLITTTVSNANVSTTSSGGSASFTYTSEFLPTVGAGSTKRLGSSTIGLSSPLTATAANTTVLSLPLPLATLLAAVNTAISATLAPAIQNTLLPFITQLLGVYLGGGDVGAIDMACGTPQLIG